ncbi:MAG: hypothetical protein KatS3mg104_0531 [Phycisphaerae bacterium]|jgi:hypothetical protein|nr:MAG: hypothetical protein KatS3mg104_0531 [Phycisphaerae bacterium]
MLNDVHPPPLDNDQEKVSSKNHTKHLTPQMNSREPGRHHARFLGEPTRTDPIYETPLEERASNFSITLSLIVLGLAAALLGSIWWMLK